MLTRGAAVVFHHVRLPTAARHTAVVVLAPSFAFHEQAASIAPQIDGALVQAAPLRAL